MLQWYNNEMDTTNIIFHWIAHFRGQVNNTEAEANLVEAEANILASRP